MTKLGLQLYSVKKAAEEDLLGTLEKVAEMGYEGVQFAGFHGHSKEAVKNKLEQLNLKVAGAHVPIESFQDGLDELLDYHNAIDNHLLICPYLPENMRKTADDYKRTAELFNQTGKKLAESGFKFGYHNHAFEFDQFNGKTGFDILYENTDPNYVKMELDCFWAVHAEHYPIDLIQKYSNRLVSLHLKDLKIKDNKPVSTEIGTGVIDIKSLINLGYHHQADWLIVEQEDFVQDPLKSAAQNIVEIKKMLTER